MEDKVLVYGWYHNFNIGDNLFINAFKHLFPKINFHFTNILTKEIVQEFQTIIIGGGSFLFSSLGVDIDLFFNKSIFYIGIGVETNIHSDHLELMKAAKYIAIRNEDLLDKIKSLNNNCCVIPDLVYCLFDNVELQAKNKNVLIVPNIAVVPQNDSPHWQYAAWEYFKSEFSQFLDVLVEDGFDLKFLSMCTHKNGNDAWAAFEILNKMRHRNDNFVLSSDQSLDTLMTQFNCHKVITQRFHGIILSELAKTSYISLYHHDKLKGQSYNCGSFLSYYGINKRLLLDSFYESNQKSLDLTLINEKFLSFQKTIYPLLCE